MKVQLRLFAELRATVGGDIWVCELPTAARISDLRASFSGAFPALTTLLRSSAFAVATEYVPDDFSLKEGDEVACIPPVSGG